MCTVKNNLETIVFPLTLKQNKILKQFQQIWAPWEAILLWYDFYENQRRLIFCRSERVKKRNKVQYTEFSRNTSIVDKKKISGIKVFGWRLHILITELFLFIFVIKVAIFFLSGGKEATSKKNIVISRESCRECPTLARPSTL